MSSQYTAKRLADWMGKAKPGDRLVYEVNSLGHLRERPTSAMKLARELEKDGHVILFQRRRPPAPSGVTWPRVVEYEARVPSPAFQAAVASIAARGANPPPVAARKCRPA